MHALVSFISGGSVASFPELVADVGRLSFHSDGAILALVSFDENANDSFYRDFTLPVDRTASDRQRSSSGVEELSGCNDGGRGRISVFY